MFSPSLYTPKFIFILYQEQGQKYTYTYLSARAYVKTCKNINDFSGILGNKFRYKNFIYIWELKRRRMLV